MNSTYTMWTFKVTDYSSELGIQLLLDSTVILLLSVENIFK